MPLNCAIACTNAIIAGPDYFCGTTSSNYSIPNLPAAATVAWSASPAGIVNVNCSTCQQTTLTRVNPGTVTLTATVSSVCSAAPVVISKPGIVVGTLSPFVGGTFNDGGTGTNQPLENTYNEVYNRTVYVSLSGSSNEFTWQFNSSAGNTSWYHPAGYSGMVINFGSPPPVYYGDYIGFSVTRTNQCGQATEPLFFFYSGPSQFYLVAPNPVNSTFTVSQIDLKGRPQYPGKKELNKDLVKLHLIDKSGNSVMVKTYPANTKSVTVDVSGLKSDIYTVLLFLKDNKTESHKIVIQH